MGCFRGCGRVAGVGYTVLAEGTQISHRIEVRRSVFLTRLVRVTDEEAARQVIADQRRSHHDARHHVSAFLLGPTRAVQRSSDDGEPAGTAGIPTLEALLQFRGGPAPRSPGASQRPGGDEPGPADLSDLVAVTTRYFGGIKLGAAGLLRSYSQAVTGALAIATFTRRVRSTEFTTTLELSQAGREEAALRAAGVPVTGTRYLSDRVVLRLAQLDQTPDPATVGGAGAELGARVSGLLGRPVELTPSGNSWVDL